MLLGTCIFGHWKVNPCGTWKATDSPALAEPAAEEIAGAPSNVAGWECWDGPRPCWEAALGEAGCPVAQAWERRRHSSCRYWHPAEVADHRPLVGAGAHRSGPDPCWSCSCLRWLDQELPRWRVVFGPSHGEGLVSSRHRPAQRPSVSGRQCRIAAWLFPLQRRSRRRNPVGCLR